MDRCDIQSVVSVILLLWAASVTHQQSVQRYFTKGTSVDAASVIDPLRITWYNVTARSRCASHCVQRKCSCVAFSFVNGSCHMFANILTGPPGADKGYNKVTECAAATVLQHTNLLAYTGCTATYNCVVGYQPQTGDSSTLTCTDDETWAPSGYRCGLIPCTYPPTLENGDVQVTTLQVGTYASYTCSAEYTNRGGNNVQRTCVLGGTWSGNIDMACKPNNVQCTVEVVTGNAHSSGTDAAVYVTLYGTYGSVTINFDGGGHTFETGDTDSISGVYFNVGVLEKIVIGHDDTGIGSGWQLHTVTVTIDGVTYSFYADAWIESSPFYITLFV